MRATRLISAIGLSLALAACADHFSGTDETLTGPAATPKHGGIEDINGLAFGTHEPIRELDDAPELKTEEAEVWAVQGQRTEVRIDYGETTDDDASFVSLVIPKTATLVDPNGRVLAKGESIRVRVRAIPSKLAVRLEPHGLQFLGGGAQLSISAAFGDTRGRPRDQLGIWYYPDNGADPVRLSSRFDPRHGQVTARLDHFSNYAIAY